MKRGDRVNRRHDDYFGVIDDVDGERVLVFWMVLGIATWTPARFVYPARQMDLRNHYGKHTAR